MSPAVLPGVLLQSSDPVWEAEDDSQLINAIADGSKNAFGEIYKRYHRQIYNYLLRIIQDEAGAEDILQEVFLAVWQGAGKFKQNSKVKTWIYRIAYKQSISWLRRHRRKQNKVDIEAVVDGRNNPEETAILAMQNAQIKRAVTSLTPKHRAVLELAFVQEMTYGEIAEILDCPIGTVKSRMSYALRNLSQLLIEIGSDHREATNKEK